MKLFLSLILIFSFQLYAEEATEFDPIELMNKIAHTNNALYDLHQFAEKKWHRRGYHSGSMTRRRRKYKRFYDLNFKAYESINMLWFHLKDQQERQIPIDRDYAVEIIEGIQPALVEAFDLIFEYELDFEVQEMADETFRNLDDLFAYLNISTNSAYTEQNADLTLTRGQYEFTWGNELCYMNSAPGDILLRKALLSDGSYDHDFGAGLIFWIRVLEFLKFNDHALKYRHAEILTRITGESNIESMSFYPPSFIDEEDRAHGITKYLHIANDPGKRVWPFYSNNRSDYVVVRVKGRNFSKERRRAEKALTKMVEKNYPEMGVCSDYINWLYGNIITSPWNRIPIIKQVVQRLYIPEYFQTPDNLEESYMTKRVCEINKNDPNDYFPKKVRASLYVGKLKDSLLSTNIEIKNHATNVLNRLKQRDLVDENNEPKVDIIEFELKD